MRLRRGVAIVRPTMRYLATMATVSALLALPMAGADGSMIANVRRGLRETHYPYPLAHRHDHRPVLRIVGYVAAGGERYLVVYRNWEESLREMRERGGSTQHASHQLLVLRHSGKRRPISAVTMSIFRRYGSKVGRFCSTATSSSTIR
jgi:hypothetical protein